jgi:hypothetical protein
MASPFLVSFLNKLKGSSIRPVIFQPRNPADTELGWATGQKELPGSRVTFEAVTFEARLSRWIYRLSAFDLDLEHQPDKGCRSTCNGAYRLPVTKFYGRAPMGNRTKPSVTVELLDAIGSVYPVVVEFEFSSKALL